MEKDEGTWSFCRAAVYLIKKTPDLGLTSGKLIEIIMKNKMVKTNGKTPERTMNSGLLREMKKGKYKGIVKRNGKFYYEPEQKTKEKIEDENKDELEDKIEFENEIRNDDKNTDTNMDINEKTENSDNEFNNYILYLNNNADYEETCFTCKKETDNITHNCAYQGCKKVYHLECIGFHLEKCLHHLCRICFKDSVYLCKTCPSAYCEEHYIKKSYTPHNNNLNFFYCDTCQPLYDKYREMNKKSL
jgi:hypothetical protein